LRGQRAEDVGQRAEGRGQRAESGGLREEREESILFSKCQSINKIFFPNLSEICNP